MSKSCASVSAWKTMGSSDAAQDACRPELRGRVSPVRSPAHHLAQGNAAARAAGPLRADGSDAYAVVDYHDLSVEAATLTEPTAV